MSDPNSSHSDPGAVWSPRAYRNLKIAVIVMGILLVVGFMVVLVTIASRMASLGTPPENGPVATAVTPDIASLLGPDAEVVSTSVDGSRLALVLRRPDGLSVVVVDLRSGQVINIISGE
jgi:hypothetical protein